MSASCSPKNTGKYIVKNQKSSYAKKMLKILFIVIFNTFNYFSFISCKLIKKA